MSLFSSIRLASNTLRADQIAMQVIGQNIANTNTPGYIREEVVLSPSPTQKLGGLLLGTGVDVVAVVQKIDKFLEERLRGAVSDRASTETQEDGYVQLETLIGELGDSDLSTSLNNFLASVSEVLNQPQDISVRNLVILQGDTLTADIKRLATRVAQIRDDLNNDVQTIADNVNRQIEEIRRLNVRIAETEGGNISKSDAVGLRDQRLAALEELASMISIRSVEHEDGTMAVYCGPDFLVAGGISREVKVVNNTIDGRPVAEIYLKDTDAPLETTAGKYQGLVETRDETLTGFLQKLDDFAATLAFEFNKIHSGGQGLSGYQEMTSEFTVNATDQALDEAGLEFTPVNGSFQVLVYNTKTGLTQTTDVLVDLNGLGDDITLDDLVAELDAIDGISTITTDERGVTITSDSPDSEFTFANDTSGLLAALGLNTFFTGSSALSLGIHAALREDPSKFAASRGGIGADTENAVDLAQFSDLPLESQNGASISVLYDSLVSATVQGSTIAQSMAEGSRVFEETLRGKKLATTGVSLDEEAVNLIAHQRSFQASARYINVLSELFDLLVRI